MSNSKKALILAVTMMTSLFLSGCGEKNNSNSNENSEFEAATNEENNQITEIDSYEYSYSYEPTTTTENITTTEMEFDVGEHRIPKFYVKNSTIEYTLENIYIPEGYEIYSITYTISGSGLVNGLIVIFINNKKVTATVSMREDGSYSCNDFGKVIKDKELKMEN